MRVGANPVRLLRETPRAQLEQAAKDAHLADRIAALAALVERDRNRPAGP